MNIPDKIQIGVKIVTIIRDGNGMMGDGLIGQNRTDENIIRLIPDGTSHIDRQTIEQTFIHECLHKINNILSLDTENREAYVNPVSELLYQVFLQIEAKESR